MAAKMIPVVVSLSLTALAGARASGPPDSAPHAAPPGASASAPASPAERAARRFPQPVRAGDLVGRRLLGPEESQPVLGRVTGVTRRRDGAFDLLVRTGGVLGLGTRLVAVPVEAVGLLGEHVALLDLDPEQLAALPTVPDPAQVPGRVPADETIRVGLVKPFH